MGLKPPGSRISVEGSFPIRIELMRMRMECASSRVRRRAAVSVSDLACASGASNAVVEVVAGTDVCRNKTCMRRRKR